MTATDILRRLLDERGVEWRGGLPTETIVMEPFDAIYVGRPDGRMHVYFRSYLTPEQAIDATLGRGTCNLVPTRDKPRSKAPTLTCSECGWWTDEIGKAWRYCPNCGREVVND